MSPHTHTTTTEKLTVPSPKTPFVRGSPVLSYLFRTYSYGAEAWTSEPCLWVGKDSFFFSISELGSFVYSLVSPVETGYKYSCRDMGLAAGLQGQCVDL